MVYFAHESYAHLRPFFDSICAHLPLCRLLSYNATRTAIDKEDKTIRAMLRTTAHRLKGQQVSRSRAA